jgi:hypothetical protein
MCYGSVREDASIIIIIIIIIIVVVVIIIIIIIVYSCAIWTLYIDWSLDVPLADAHSMKLERDITVENISKMRGLERQ